MSLKQTIDADIKKAMLAKDQDRLRALRAIKSLILLEETKEGAAADGLSQEQEIKLLSKAAKQRRESAEIFQGQGRSDLAEKELAEVKVVEEYLPRQLSAEELEATLKALIAELGATGPSHLGQVMGQANARLAGQAEGKAISEVVRRLLAQ